MKNFKLKNRLILSTVALLFVTRGVTASSSVESGDLVINLNRDVFHSFGVPAGVNTVIEHYFDQSAANVSTGTQLIEDHLDHLEILGDYSDLLFGINNLDDSLDSALGPIIGINHQLQGTDFAFSEHSTPTGQIGFGGVLRLGFPFAGTSIDAGFGEIAIGDFTLSYVDRSEVTANASGWLFTSTVGLSSGSYYPLWDTKDVILSTENGTLTISGNLIWTPEAISFLGAFGGPSSKDAGTFSVTAATNDIPVLDHIIALKSMSLQQVSDRPVRITANARLKQAVHYYNIAAANIRQNKDSIAHRFLKLSKASLEKYISVLDRGISKNKFPAEEVMPLIDRAYIIIHDINHLMEHSELPMS